MSHETETERWVNGWLHFLVFAVAVVSFLGFFY